jgi:hypothetical protein
MLATRSQTLAAREARLRRALARQGFTLHKSRWRLGSIDNFGGYQIINPYVNGIVAGSRFDLSLDDVEEWLATLE